MSVTFVICFSLSNHHSVYLCTNLVNRNNDLKRYELKNCK